MNERWRVDRKVGRTIYLQRGDEPSDADHLIGIMDNVELARKAVIAYNFTYCGQAVSREDFDE